MKRKNAGFTLVEIIVVMVILAILTAITIPALTGWISRARKKQAYVDLHIIALAGKSAYIEIYATRMLNEFDYLTYGEDAAFTALVDSYIKNDTMAANLNFLSAYSHGLQILYDKNGVSYLYIDADGTITITP